MIALHVCKNEEVIELATRFFEKSCSERLELYSAFTEEQREQLYEKCRAIPRFPKVIISIFEFSTIRNQLHLLEKYDINMEVCVPVITQPPNPEDDPWAAVSPSPEKGGKE
jgi:hypothetical protein